MGRSVLVNSDAAVSEEHSVFLVGRRCCHMKRTFVSALAFELAAACDELLARQAVILYEGEK